MSTEKAIDDLATYLALAKRAHGTGSVRLSDFKAVEVFTPEHVDFMHNHAPQFGEARIPTGCTVSDVQSFDMCMMSQVTDCDRALFSMSRWRRVHPKSVRGKVWAVRPFMVECRGVILYENGKYDSTDPVVFGSFTPKITDRKSWSKLSTGFPLVPNEIDEQSAWNLKMSLGLQFVRDYDWRVVIGYESSPTISFATDPVGAAEVFRLRDIPEGRSRRAAILHWVRAHWRKKRDDSTSLTRVREHIRGSNKFVWNGLSCEVIPSPYDQRRLRAERTSA